MYNDEIIEEDSKFDNDVVYHIYGTNVIRIEGVLLKSKIAKYKITITIKPTNTIDSLKVLRNNKIEDLDTYNYNDEEIVNIMNIISKHDETNSSEIESIYNQYVNKNERDNIPVWDIFKLMVQTIKMIGNNMTSILKYVDISQIK